MLCFACIRAPGVSKRRVPVTPKTSGKEQAMNRGTIRMPLLVLAGWAVIAVASPVLAQQDANSAHAKHSTLEKHSASVKRRCANDGVHMKHVVSAKHSACAKYAYVKNDAFL